MLLSVPGKVVNRVILLTGFHEDRFCTDQIATLRIIVEQSMGWDSSLYINVVDYEKAFDRLDRDTLWKLLQHYGILDKLISLIRNIYEDTACRVIHAGQFTASFMVKRGVRQGCLLSPRMSSVAILIPARHRLDHEKTYRKQKKGDRLDTLDPAGGPGLCA